MTRHKYSDDCACTSCEAVWNDALQRALAALYNLDLRERAQVRPLRKKKKRK